MYNIILIYFVKYNTNVVVLHIYMKVQFKIWNIYFFSETLLGKTKGKPSDIAGDDDDDDDDDSDQDLEGSADQPLDF